MRIRLSLTIDVHRERQSDDAPRIDESTGALVERAEPHVLGFVIPSTERGE